MSIAVRYRLHAGNGIIYHLILNLVLANNITVQIISNIHVASHGILNLLQAVNLSSFVQSRNTQNDERKRFLEPEVATLPRTAPRQPPLQRLGLGRLSGKCYNELPTGWVSACLIPIAVGGPATAFSRRSVKTGGNRNASSGSTPSFSESSIVHAA